MFFNPHSNVWDLCTLLDDPADHPPDNLDDLDNAEEEIGDVVDLWFMTPKAPPSPPDTDLMELVFLYHCYGFLTTEPTTRVATPKKWMSHNVQRIPGLAPTGNDFRLEYLAEFHFTISQGHLPHGHSDFSEDSPENECFPFSTSGIINCIIPVKVPDLSDGHFFLFKPNNCHVQILIHDSLTVAEMGRVHVQPKLALVVDYLLRNGSQFTVLTSQTENLDADRLHILSFPARPMGWVATAADYNHYMSTLKLILKDCPYVAAAALACGGIAWLSGPTSSLITW